MRRSWEISWSYVVMDAGTMRLGQASRISLTSQSAISKTQSVTDKYPNIQNNKSMYNVYFLVFYQSSDVIQRPSSKRVTRQVGVYKGQLVAVRRIPTNKLELSRSVLLELKVVRKYEKHNSIKTITEAQATASACTVMEREYVIKMSLYVLLL